MPDWQGTPAVLHEPLDPPGSRRRWRAEADGRPALAVEAQLGSAREAAAVGERLRRLHARPSPHLTPILGWAVEGSAAWILLPEVAPGRTLAELLRRGPLPAAEATAVAWAVLSGLEAMHQAQVAHGSVSTQTVLVDAGGAVRLDGGWLVPEARSATDEMVADVEAAGAAGLAALGASAAGSGSTPAELAAPAVVRMLRAIAAGASGSNVAGARMALAATAGGLVEPEGLARARAALAARVEPAGLAVAQPAPVPTPAAPRNAPRPAAPADREAVPAPSVPFGRYVATAADFEDLIERPPWDRLVIPAMILVAALILLVIGWIAVRALAHRSAPVASSPAVHASAQPTPAASASTPPSATPQPSPSPSFGPPAAAPVKSVALTLSGCAVGGHCTGEIIVTTDRAPAATDIQWTVRAFDPCTGATTDAGTGHFTEQQGWTSIDVNQAVALPAARGALLVAAVTTAPANAASPPVTVGQGGC